MNKNLSKKEKNLSKKEKLFQVLTEKGKFLKYNSLSTGNI
jgi:hypothetical protein